METLGEGAFDAYLRRAGLCARYEEAYEGRLKRPDFAIEFEGVVCFFDVKDRTAAPDDEADIREICSDEPVTLTSSPELDDVGDDDDDDDGTDLDFEAACGAAGDPPYRWIREQIEQGRRKFREYKDFPCAVVLYDTIDRSWELEHPDWILGAMYGDRGILISPPTHAGAQDAGAPRSAFLDGGRMFRPSSRIPQNTSISALITLRHIRIGQARSLRYLESIDAPFGAQVTPEMGFELGFDPSERQSGVIVWENAYARTPLPRRLFRGAYDERWESSGTRIRRTYVGDRLEEFYSVHPPSA